MTDQHYAALSLWLETAGDLTPRPRLLDDIEADIAIVGAGLTGLWTAYYLAEADPKLRIVVLERDIAGSGASGRNGGWCAPFFGPSIGAIAAEHGRQAAIATQGAMLDSIREIGRVCQAAGIDADYRMAGAIMAATTNPQAERLREMLDELRSFGFGEDDFRLLSSEGTAERVRARGVISSLLIPHAAAIHPARLTRGLAVACENLGVMIHETTAVTSIGDGSVETGQGRVRADVIVRATEAYTGSLARHERLLAPIEDAMIATAPLPSSFWEEHWSGQETFGDTPHMFVYAQRTADDRIAIGGTRIRYRLGGRTPESVPFHSAWETIRNRLTELFPVLHDAEITHKWGGYLAFPRNNRPSVGFRRDLGIAWAGGFVGDGNPTANLAGRTLRDLILERADSELTRLPWVGQRWNRWEPEPLTWLGINGAMKLFAAADASETRTGRPSILSRVAGPFLN